jgi:NADH-quinone oxidoreductase subunit J
MATYLVFLITTLLLISAAMVIIAKNPLHSVLYLVGSFLFSSLLLFIFDNEFLALFFLIIYLGAIAILFLFVVMMLDIKYHELQTSRLYFPAGALIGGVLLLETLSAFSKFFSQYSNAKNSEHNIYLNWYDTLDSLNDVMVLGQVFYTQYIVQILIAGLILYVAVIGVALLTIKSAFEKTPKGQFLYKQLSRKNIL